MVLHTANAALYLRQSLDRTGDGLAIDRQREANLRFAQARGWTVVAEYVDNSTSATNGTRPEWERMLANAELGRFDVILAWSLDRLTRGVADTERMVNLCERRGVRVATTQGDLDLTTDQGRIVGRILTAVARGEIERKSARQRLANAQRAEQGRPPVGPRAIGWELDGTTVVPHEADAVRRGFELILAGGSLRGVARLWNDLGLRTTPKRPRGAPKDAPRVGQPWRSYSVRDVLRNPRYAGLRAVRGEVVGEGKWPAIVTEETWRAAVGILTDSSRRTTPDTRRKYLLSGLALCGVCVEPTTVNAGGTRHGYRTYKCSRVKHLQRQAEMVDALIGQVVVARLAKPDVADLVARDRPDVSAVQGEAATLRTRRDQLAEDFAAGGLTRSQLLKGTARIESRLAEIEAHLADAAQTLVLAAFLDRDDAQAVWDDLDLDQRRAVVETLMTVTLLPVGRGARRFDPGSVRIEWKGRAGV